MTKLSEWKVLSVTMALALSAVISSNLAIAQPKPTSKASAKADAKSGDEEAAPAKGKGRLPAYYKDIVDAKQKDKIYSIQAEFNGKIDALEEQIKKLTADRDAAVEGVLTAEQKGKLKKAKEEAAAKRKKPEKGEKPTDSTPAE